MTQPAPQPAAADPGPWPRLPDLDRRLRAAGFPVGIDRWQNALDLIAALAAHGALPADPRDLRPLLGPLFCRSPQEQQAFAGLFEQWCAAVSPAVAPAAEAAPPPPPPRQAPPRTPLWWVLLPLSALVLAGALGLHAWLTPGPDPRQPTAPPQPPVVAAAPSAAGPTDHPAVPLAPFPPRTPPEVLRPSPQARGWLASADWLLPVLPVLPGLGICAWLAWRRLRLSTVLRHRRGDPESPLRDLTLAEADDDLFDGPLVRAALRRLHTPVSVPTRRLDERATCERAARNLGLFLPVYRDQPRVPDCVVLVDSHHRGDHLAGLAFSLIRRLRAAGLEVSAYVYQRDPTRVRPAFAPASTGRSGSGCNGPGRTLAGLAGQHAGARLLIIGDAADLMDLARDRPAPWTEVLTLWPGRGLLATRPVPDPWRDALAGAGLALAPFGAAGLIQLAGDLAAAPTADPGATGPRSAAAADPGSAALPPRLAHGVSGGRDPTPAERAALGAALDAWLGPRGRLLLAAVAVYPGLHPGLTRRLDLALFADDDARTRTARLVRLARLPWLRGGSLPYWLRLDLHAATPPAARRRIGAIYLDLLRSVVLDGETGIRLPVALPPPGAGAWARRRHWLRAHGRRLDRWVLDLLRGAAPDAALSDRIFVDTVLRPGLLDFRLPAWLARLLPGDRRRWRPVGLLPPLALGVLLGVGVALVWQGGSWPVPDAGLRAQAAAALLAYEQRSHAVVKVLELIHTPQTKALAESLALVLRRTGFPKAVLVELPAPPAAEPGAPPPVNTVQVGDLGDAATAPFIAARLQYLTWGEPPVIADRLADPPPGAPAERLEPPPAGQVRVWLRSTGPGEGFTEPAMVAIPAGSFLMGSPDSEPRRSKDEEQHPVQIKRLFAIGKYEVTVGEFRRFVAATGYRTKAEKGDGCWGLNWSWKVDKALSWRAAGFDQTEESPVVCVSWNDARDYAAWLSRETGKAYRLPTEAEWEYAARAGTTTPFWTGNCIHTDQANYNGKEDYNGCGAKTGVYRGKTLPVGSLAANPWGLHDVVGNVGEWTCSAYAFYYYGKERACIDNSYANKDLNRVIRGGSWGDGPALLRSAFRLGFSRSFKRVNLGFRLAQDL